jgi:rhodanese-related sulfurtransferase
MSTNVIDIIDPLDYEEYLDEHREKIENDPLRHLLEYPTDDIDFVRIDRQYRTIIPTLPEKESENIQKMKSLKIIFFPFLEL